MRKTFSAILLVLAALLSIPSVALLWVQTDIVNQSRYAAIADGLATNPQVQAQVADRITDAIMEKLAVGTLIKDADVDLPPRLSNLLRQLGPTLTSSVEEYVHRAATKLVTSEQFAQLWNSANRVAHQAVFKVLRGQGDTVTVDLGRVAEAVKTRLIDAGFELATRIPEVHPMLELAQSPKIARARNLYSAFQVLRWLLPVLTLLCLAGGIALAHNRLRALMWGAIGIALAMGVAGAVTWLLQDRITNGRAVYAALVISYHGLLRWVLLIAVLVAAAAYLVEFAWERRTTPPQEN
jgi:hypothetical protein